MNKDKKVKFYINKNLIDKNLPHNPLLYPFWGPDMTNRNPFRVALFNAHNYDTDYFCLVDNIKDADFILIPYRYNALRKKNYKLFETHLDESKKYNKPVLIDATGDIEYKIDYKNVYALRISGYRFEKSSNDIHIPPYADDLLERFYDGDLHIREKQEVPIVGFAGWAYLSPYQYVRSFIRGLPNRIVGLFNKNYAAKKKGVFFRMETIKILKASSLIRTNFLVRKSFSGNRKTVEKDPQELRKEFVDNFIDSDYALCIRGDANASVRLFEALSMGRIPIILDTEYIFPLENKVNYKDFSLIVDFRDLPRIDSVIRDFHDKISNEEFKEMQHRAREAYRQYFRVDSLTPHIMNYLMNFINIFKK